MRLKLMIGVMFLTSVLAYQASAQGVHLGLEAGVNLSNFTGPAAATNGNTKAGFVGGAFLSVDLMNSLAFQPELLYSQKGESFSGTTTELDYFEVPLLLKLSLGTPGINPGLLVGPAFGLNLVSQRNFSDGSAPEVFTDITKLDTGLIVGIQADIDKLLVTGRYEIGLSSLDTEGDKAQNGTLSFMVGYSFI